MALEMGTDAWGSNGADVNSKSEVHPIVPMEIIDEREESSQSNKHAENKKPGCYARCCVDTPRKKKMLKFLV